MDPVEEVCREHWGRLISLLVLRCRDLSLAEDALADAVEAAVRTWPVDGAPREPAAWLLAVARRKLVDRARGDDVARRKRHLLVVAHAGPGERPVEDAVLDAELPDERLRLVLLCCHPALAPENQMALTLRFVAGLPTSEVARLFLVPEATMAARLTRAKKRIAASAIPFALPDPERLGERVEVAARAIHLLFTAGYAPGAGGDEQRRLAGEAVALARLLHELAPGEPATPALLALLLLTHARRAARFDDAGDLVLLPDQDRSRWDRSSIDEGLALLGQARARTPYGRELVLQAGIQALHDVAASAGATDWQAISRLYAELEDLTGSPVVRLNRAVAVAEAEGPEHGLALLAGLDDALGHGHRLPAVRAELLGRLGRADDAAAEYRVALDRCQDAAERRFLVERLAGVSRVGP